MPLSLPDIDAGFPSEKVLLRPHSRPDLFPARRTGGRQAPSGFSYPDGVLLRKKIQRVNITPAAGGQWDLPVPGTVSTPWGIFSAKIFPYSGEKILEKKYTKWFDCDKIKYGLTVRTRKSGDYLVINSSGNRKKLTRCMIDDKIPGEDRERIPLVTAGNEVLWIAGGRMNTGCGITSQTQRVLQIEYQREG